MSARPDLPEIHAGPYQFMPDMAPEQFEALKRDIAERGVVTPVDIDETGAILDGHHRYRAWLELKKNEPPPVIVRARLRAWGSFGRLLEKRGYSPEGAGAHIDWLVVHQRYKSPDEWLGDIGAGDRKRWRQGEPSDEFKAAWRDMQRAEARP